MAVCFFVYLHKKIEIQEKGTWGHSAASLTLRYCPDRTSQDPWLLQCLSIPGVLHGVYGLTFHPSGAWHQTLTPQPPVHVHCGAPSH
jgi:hypothetical protein